MCPDAAGVRKIKDRYKGKKIIFFFRTSGTYKAYEFLIAATKYLKRQLHDYLSAVRVPYARSCRKR